VGGVTGRQIHTMAVEDVEGVEHHDCCSTPTSRGDPELAKLSHKQRVRYGPAKANSGLEEEGCWG
jgi:hypothetical protein